MVDGGIPEHDWVPYLRHLFNVYDESGSNQLEKVELLELIGECMNALVSKEGIYSEDRT